MVYGKNESFCSTSDDFIKSSRFQSIQDGLFSLSIFPIKRHNDGYVDGSFRRFLFGMSPDIPAFKVSGFTSDFKFWIGVNESYY